MFLFICGVVRCGVGWWALRVGVAVGGCFACGEECGGMSNRYADPTVRNYTFSHNRVGFSGTGMFSLHGSGNLTVTNCLFFGNSSDTGGGAIEICDNDVMIINCTFVGNVAGDSGLGLGGALYVLLTSSTLENCIFWGNSATDDGSEIYVSGDVNLTISYCDIEGGWDGPKVYDYDYEDGGITNGGGNISSDSGIVNIFDFSDITIGDDTTITIKVTDASLYAVDDEIEYDNDSVARKVTGVNTTTDIVTFANDALSASSAIGKTVYNWGSGATDMDEDLHLTSGSDCIDEGDPSGTYTGQKDNDVEDRVNGSEVDIGADEYYSS
ncbi:MAG: hypothetical protein ACYS9Y_03415 [Planctomycetota bacterium]|jgi:predicted outer membrane repeat protein